MKMRHSAIAPALLLFICLAGCDGQYAYRYHGRLVGAVGDPIDALPVVALGARSNISPPEIGQAGTITDKNGEFSGTFWMSTVWVFGLRPPPPPIETVYLYTDSTKREQEFNGVASVISQSSVVNGVRYVELGTICLPEKSN
jgi:hypothetical protein